VIQREAPSREVDNRKLLRSANLTRAYDMAWAAGPVVKVMEAWAWAYLS
jgi:hypothetical protein